MLRIQLHDLLNQPTNNFRPGGRQPLTVGPPPNGQQGRVTYDRRLLLVLLLVENNLRRQLAVGDLAAAVNLSAGRLAHLFKSQVGVSVQHYLNDVRMEKARELLESGVLSGKEVAAVVGIPNASRFCRTFKARYGTTPRQYRRGHLRIDLNTISVASGEGKLVSPHR
jgi:transcriptional regulator GlxA family with amidase domain